MDKKYVIGIDFGTLSARASVFSVHSGEKHAGAVYEYPCGVMTDGIFSGHACADPRDYRNALECVLKDSMRRGGIRAEEIIAVGIDCTACSLLPVSETFQPLICRKEYQAEPNAFIRLWKDHSAESLAREITVLAKSRNEDWLKYCGGMVSAEWMLPKLLQTYREAPQLCAENILFLEAGDWLTALLTGELVRSSSAAGFVGNRMEEKDFPSDRFLDALEPGFSGFVKSALRGTYLPVGAKAGEVTQEAAECFGLKAGTPVCVYNVDAQAAYPAAGIPEGSVLAVMGTSTVYLMTDPEKKSIPGISCTVKDGILPGCFGCSAGQSCSGDMLDWYVKNAVPGSVLKEAEIQGLDIHQFLTQKASALKPGATGLLALDWLGGNRAILRDTDLSGMIVGLTRETRPEEIYRALAEATAFGARKILERCAEYGAGEGTLYMSGGIPGKNPMIMQVYADVLKREIAVLGENTGPVLGSAITALYASGGYETLREAAGALIREKVLFYHPSEENSRIYDELYPEYERLHDYFGRGENSIMKKLRTIKERGRYGR